MMVTIEILAGNDHREPTKQDIDRQIEAIWDSRGMTLGEILNSDTTSILMAIREQLPDKW